MSYAVTPPLEWLAWPESAESFLLAEERGADGNLLSSQNLDFGFQTPADKRGSFFAGAEGCARGKRLCPAQPFIVPRSSRRLPQLPLD